MKLHIKDHLQSDVKTIENVAYYEVGSNPDGAGDTIYVEYENGKEEEWKYAEVGGGEVE